jgi:hypothetical protein
MSIVKDRFGSSVAVYNRVSMVSLDTKTLIICYNSYLIFEKRNIYFYIFIYYNSLCISILKNNHIVNILLYNLY